MSERTAEKAQPCTPSCVTRCTDCWARPKTETDAIVAALTAERTRRGMSMREVAREAGVSPACVHSWEHGTRAPSLHNLRAWAHALGRDLVLTCPDESAMQGLTEKAADLPSAEGSGYCLDSCTWPHDHRFERDGIPWPSRNRTPPGSTTDSEADR